MSRRPHVWTGRRVAMLRTLWEADWSIPQIAAEIGVSEWAVKHARREYGMPPRRNGRPKGRPKKPPATISKTQEKVHRIQALPPSTIAWPNKQQLMAGR